MRVVGIDRFARLSGVLGKAISRLHEVAVEFFIQDFNVGKPFAGSRADPSRPKGTYGKTMMAAERLAIHVGGEDRIGVERFLDGDAANERRNSAEHDIGSTKHDVLAGGFEASGLQHVAQAWAGETGIADGSASPLDAGDLRPLKSAAVTGALQSISDAVLIESVEIRHGECKRALHFSGEFDLPRGGVN